MNGYFGARLSHAAFLAICLLLLCSPAFAESQEGHKTTLYFFWGDGCPHCAHEEPFLEQLQRDYPELEVKSYETWYNAENARLYSNLAEAFGTNAMGVPGTFVDDKMWMGYSDSIGEEIRAKVDLCVRNGCADPMDKLEGASGKEEILIAPGEATLPNEVCIHAFLISNCTQCSSVLPYLESLAEEHDANVVIHDVSSPEEMEKYSKFKETYGLEDGGYPIVFIGERFIIGGSAIRETLEPEILSCLEGGCPCPDEKIRGVFPYIPAPQDITPEEGTVISLPFFGEVDTSQISLPATTIILAGMDSFNPCAFFVLFFLLSMLVYAKSRGRMLLIGGTFVFFSALIYFLFMSAWLNLFLFIGQLMIITTIAGIVALIVAAINIKDFFFFEKGFSLVIPESAKPGLFKRMRDLIKAESLPAMMVGTIVLAIAANTYELLCTAGFPMVFTRILTLNDLPTLDYYLYLAFYNIIYIIPLLLIVLMFVATLGARKLTEWQGQVLKLVSGMMMLCLGSVLLIDPALLNNVLTGAALLALSLSASAIIIFITSKTRKTEKPPKQSEFEENNGGTESGENKKVV